MDKRRVFHTEAAPAIPGPWPQGGGERITPASNDAGSPAQQVLVPLLQSLITGATVAALVGVLSWAFWIPDVAVFGPLALVAGMLAFAITWAVGVSDCRGLLRITETWGDPPQPAPAELAPVKPSERVILVRADPEAMPDLDAPPAPAPGDPGPSDFERFLAACLRSTAQAELERRFNRPYIQHTRDQLITAGLASWRGKGPNAGWQLTARGVAVAERVSKCGAE